MCSRGLQLIAAVAILYISLPRSTTAALLVTPDRQSGEEGNDFTFKCEGTGLTAELQWYRRVNSSTELQLDNLNAKYDIYSLMDNETDTKDLTLTILAATPEDTGDYDCKSGDVSFNVYLKVEAVTNVEIRPSHPELVEDKDLLLSCSVNNATDKAVAWSVNKGTSEMQLTGGDDTSHVQVLNNGTLIIRAMTPEDAGIYMCTYISAEGTDGLVFTKTAIVNVGGEIVLKAPKSVKYTEGDRALIECEASVITNALLPNITWLVNGGKLAMSCPGRCTVTEETTQHTITSTLEITKITMDDRKNYTCIAFNSATEESSDILLRVRDRLAALWPFLGIVSEVVILIVIIFIHEKCSQGEDFGEEDEDDDDIKKEKKKIPDGESDMPLTSKE